MSSTLSVRGAAGLRAAAMFRPRSLLLVADPALAETAIIARNLAAGGFEGRRGVIGLAVEGLEPAASIEALPEPPDLAVLCLPPARL